LSADSYYVAVNDDDNNDNGISDLDDGTVSGEDDLVAIHLSVDTPRCNDKVRLAIDQPQIIKVWSNALKQNEITNGTTWNACGYGSFPATLYVEGIIPGGPKSLWFQYLGYYFGADEIPVPPQPEIQFTFVGVDKVVKAGTSDEGPIYVCPCETVDLEAKPSPPGMSFPSGEPHWEIVSKPDGANPSLNPTSGSATTTLSGITKLGDYVIRAKCGGSASGDTIIVKTPSSTGYWEEFMPAWSCPPENQAFTMDDCDNYLWVYCDTGNHLGLKAYSWWYNVGTPQPRQTEVGCCVWIGGLNAFRYKYSHPGKKLFLKTNQASCNDHKYDWSGEGCWGYWCYRYVEFDCVDGVGCINWWREDGSECPCAPWPNPTYSEPCPGPSSDHPGYPG